MGNGLKILTIRGIPIILHWSFLLLFPVLAWQVATLYQQSLGWGALLYGLIFLCVGLHELAHAVVAQRYGIRVRHIVLLPVGGIASLERIPEHAGQEARIAFAGPAFNLAAAAAIFGFIVWLPGVMFDPLDVWANPSAFTRGTVMLFQINVLMAVFNLIPIPPLDGSKLLFSILPQQYGRTRMFLERYGQIFLVIVVIFVWQFISPIIWPIFKVFTGVDF